MDRREEYLLYEEYLKAEGLDQLIDFRENADYNRSVFDAVNGELTIPIPPQPADLVYLHQTARKRKSFTILEFGTGYSTIVLADALQKNQRDWEKLSDAPKIRNRFMFQKFSVDASQSWIENVQARLPRHVAERVHI